MADIDEWQTEMQLKPLRLGRVQLYTTGLSEEERGLTGVGLVDSVETAIADSIARGGDEGRRHHSRGPLRRAVLRRAERHLTDRSVHRGRPAYVMT